MIFKIEIINEELASILEKHGDSRRTEIIPFSGDLSLEDMIADEDMIITITHNGYIKRLPVARNYPNLVSITPKHTDVEGDYIKKKTEIFIS